MAKDAAKCKVLLAVSLLCTIPVRKSILEPNRSLHTLSLCITFTIRHLLTFAQLTAALGN